MPGRDVEVVGAAGLGDLVKDVAFLSGAGGVAAGELEVGESGGCGGSQEGEEVVGLVAVGEHAGVCDWVEVLHSISNSLYRKGEWLTGSLYAPRRETLTPSCS